MSILSKTNSHTRFIHHTEPFAHYTGMTVAYIRNGNSIFFAYSLCEKRDKYVKSVGRKLTETNLAENIENIEAAPQYNYVDLSRRVGHMSVDILVQNLPGVECLSNQHIAGMTTEDFKHSHISYVLANSLLNALNK